MTLTEFYQINISKLISRTQDPSYTANQLIISTALEHYNHIILRTPPRFGTSSLISIIYPAYIRSIHPSAQITVVLKHKVVAEQFYQDYLRILNKKEDQLTQYVNANDTINFPIYSNLLVIENPKTLKIVPMDHGSKIVVLDNLEKENNIKNAFKLYFV